MKLALGTVQFGLDYGVSNLQGQVTEEEVKKILSLAKASNINALDCAAAYGNSESILGKLHESQCFDIISKIPDLPCTESSLIPSFNNSLSHLNRKNIDTLLLHNVNTLLDHPHSDNFCHELNHLKSQKKIKRIGVSIYKPEHIEQSLRKLNIDIVQAPLNIFDQRFCHTSVVDLLQKQNIKLHVRSAFLQGLLLIARDSWPTYFSPYREHLIKFDNLAKQLHISKLTLALLFMVQNSLIKPYIEKIVVGCCSKEQLKEIIQSYNEARALPLNEVKWETFACHDQALINPSSW